MFGFGEASLWAKAKVMKFDPTRVNAIFEKLGDPNFQGPGGEERVADFVAGEFERMGLSVLRRQVHGSRFPQRAAPLVGWLGYGALITVAFTTVLRDSPVEALVAIFLLGFAGRW